MEMQSETGLLVSLFVNCSEKQKQVFKGLGTFVWVIFCASYNFPEGGGTAEASYLYKYFPTLGH